MQPVDYNQPNLVYQMCKHVCLAGYDYVLFILSFSFMLTHNKMKEVSESVRVYLFGLSNLLSVSLEYKISS